MTAAELRESIGPGSRVRYALRFLLSIKASPADPICTMCGTVVRVDDVGGLPLSTVQWDDGTLGVVNVNNLFPTGHHFADAVEGHT